MNLRPEWLRIPDAVKLFGIGKSSLYDLIRRGKVRSSLVRSSRATKATGKKHGSRLVSAASLESYIASFATGGEVEDTPRKSKSARARQQ